MKELVERVAELEARVMALEMQSAGQTQAEPERVLPAAGVQPTGTIDPPPRAMEPPYREDEPDLDVTSGGTVLSSS